MLVTTRNNDINEGFSLCMWGLWQTWSKWHFGFGLGKRRPWENMVARRFRRCTGQGSVSPETWQNPCRSGWSDSCCWWGFVLPQGANELSAGVTTARSWLSLAFATTDCLEGSGFKVWISEALSAFREKAKQNWLWSSASQPPAEGMALPDGWEEKMGRTRPLS